MDLPISHHQHLKLGIRFQPRNRVPQNQIIQIAIRCYNTPKISQHSWLWFQPSEKYYHQPDIVFLKLVTNLMISPFLADSTDIQRHPPPEGPAAGRPKQVPCKPEPCRAFSKPLAVNGQQACHGEMM